MLVGIGEIVWDVFPDGPRLGGAPANFVYYSQLLNQKSILVSRIGDDELGKRALGQLSSNKMILDYIQIDKAHPTGTVKVELDPKGIPVFSIQENAAWDYLEKSPALQELALQASAVYFGSLGLRSPQSRETINWFLSQTGPDCLRVLDINLRPPFYSKELLGSLLKLTDILKLNDGELRTIGRIFFPNLSGEETISRELIKNYKIKLIALTKGEKGSRLITAEKESCHPGFSVEVVDTVGAGDSFAAALVVGLLRGEELDLINYEANRLASQVCSQQGAWAKVKI